MQNFNLISVFLIKKAQPAGMVRRRRNEMVAAETTSRSGVNRRDLSGVKPGDTLVLNPGLLTLREDV